MGLWLDVAIGVSLVFGAFSALCSGVLEFVAWALELRARNLRSELGRLLGDPRARSLWGAVRDHPLVKELYQPIRGRSPHGPSYIPTEVFSAALVDLLFGRGPLDAMGGIRAALAEAAADPACAGLATALRDALAAPADEAESALVAAAGSDDRDDPKAREKRRDALAAHLGRVAASMERALFMSLVEAVDAARRRDVAGRLLALARVGAPGERVWRAAAGMPPSPARTALLAWFEATGAEARAQAADRVEAIVRGGAEGLEELVTFVGKLPAGHCRDAIARSVEGANEAARAAARLDLHRLLERPAEELRRAVELVGGDGETGRLLSSLLDRSERSVADVRARFEGWFDHAMEHCSATYKRKSQLWLLAIAALVVAAFNVDAMRVTRSLVDNAAARAEVVRVASTAAQPLRDVGEASEGDGGARAESVRAQFARAMAQPVPLGWQTDPIVTAEEPARWTAWVAKLAGLLTSVLALTLGAPFWFSVVNLATNLRAVGTPPQSTENRQPGNARSDRGRTTNE